MLAKQLREFIRAGYSGVYITTFEQEDAQAEIGLLCMQSNFHLACWDCDSGLTLNSGNNPDINDPIAMLRASKEWASTDTTTIVILRNFHKFLSGIDVIQCLQSRLNEGKSSGIVYVILAPSVEIPPEISRSFVILHHTLPDKQALREIAESIGQSEELPSADEFDALLDASAGLTRLEAENTYALSIVRHGKIAPQEVWSLKAQSLEKTGLMTLHQGTERFSNLGGLDNLKSFCLSALKPNTNRKANPRGVLLLGVPGTGKSALARALGNEVDLPTITLDIGALMGSLVGETERKTREAIQTIEAMGKCIVYIDEVEKALSGANGSNGDSGTSGRQFGLLLTWLADPNKKAFVIATSNNVAGLPKEFLRSGRFNGIFFFDLPSREQKDKIWSLYLNRFGLADSAIPPDAEWTGAEIEACCETADLLGASLHDAASYIVPVARTAQEQVNALRDWASGRCLSADFPGVYQRNPAQTSTPGATRRIDRSPSDN